MLINEFGNIAFVIKDNDRVCTYLFGLYSQTQPVTYAHIIAVINNCKRLGLRLKLYEHFIIYAREKLCSQVKAIMKPTNFESIAFHKNIGMELTGNDVIDGVPVILDYSGPGEHRVFS